MPDVRARVAAIELLLREGLGRPATAEEARSPHMPISIAAVSFVEPRNEVALTPGRFGCRGPSLKQRLLQRFDVLCAAIASDGLTVDG